MALITAGSPAQAAPQLPTVHRDWHAHGGSGDPGHGGMHSSAPPAYAQMKGGPQSGGSRGYVPYDYVGYNQYSDFDGNRSFDADKWNDWWHERPERAFPRWLSRNHDCARPWYSGDVLTC